MVRIAVASLVAAAAGSAIAQPTFTQIPGFAVSGMSADGTVLVGSASGQAARWTAAGGIELLGTATSVRVSGDGLVICGETLDPVLNVRTAAIWEGGTTWRNLGGIPWSINPGSVWSSPFGLNTDGSKMVGLAYACSGFTCGRAFVWTEATTMLDLGTTVPGRSSRANGISGDGNVIIGWQDRSDGYRQGAMWQYDPQTMQYVQTTLFATANSDPVSEAQAANSDGSVVVGNIVSSDMGAWRWTRSGGLQSLGFLPGFNWRGYATDVSEDGTIVVGYSGFSGPFDRTAHIWIEGGTLQPLTEWFTGIGGVLPPNTTLGSALAISDNGRIITGLSTTIPSYTYLIDTGAEPCYADCDTTTGVNVLDIFDFLCFQNRYDLGDPYACDCDTTTGAGVCDIFDFLCFQNAYDLGCP